MHPQANWFYEPRLRSAAQFQKKKSVFKNRIAIIIVVEFVDAD